MRKFALLRETPALWDAPFAIPSGSFVETLWKRAKVYLVGLITKSEGIRRTRQRPFTEARFEKRPCRRTPADQGTVSICVTCPELCRRNLWNLWLKVSQSKMNDYAKQNRNENSHPALKIFKCWVLQFCLFPFTFLLSKLNQSVWVNYAKQTQFTKYSNERKFCYNNELWTINYELCQ